MSSLQRAKPENTLAIILGASEWPHYINFQANPSFKKSAEDFRDYLLDKNGFNLPQENLFYSFNAEKFPPEIILEISHFLKERLNRQEPEKLPKDLIVYYVGHGGFREETGEYYLAVRLTQRPDLYGTSISIQSLATAIKEEARHLRRYIILDSCFSAAAYKSFQSSPNEVVYKKIMDTLPAKGTALLCSTSKHNPSLAPTGMEYTMFTGALIEALRHGDKDSPQFLSIQDIYSIIRDLIRNRFEDEAIRPELHTPEQRHGNVAEIPLFPNQATAKFDDSVGDEEIGKKIDSFNPNSYPSLKLIFNIIVPMTALTLSFLAFIGITVNDLNFNYWEDPFARIIRLFSFIFYGNGSRPYYPMIWSIFTVLYFTFFWKMKLTNRNDPTKQYSFSDALIYSSAVFLSGTKLFVDPPELPQPKENTKNLVRYLYIIERTLGALFSALFAIAIYKTINLMD